MFCFNEFAFTVQVKHKKEIAHTFLDSWLYFDMFVFYDWPFPLHTCVLWKNVAYFPFNSWLSFQRLCRLLLGYILQFMTRSFVTRVGVTTVLRVDWLQQN